MRQRSDEYYMQKALYWAAKAAELGEVPVGCVIVLDGKIIAHGYNRREAKQQVSEHAEMMAIRSASRKIASWRLENCRLFVTLEPCFMCAAAIQQARIAEVVFGACDPKAGAVISLARFFEDYPQNHRVDYSNDVLATECSAILKDFFKQLRARK